MSLDQFVSSVKQKGLARTNRFSVQISVPKIMQGDESYGGGRYFDVRMIQLFCEQTTLPGFNYSTNPTRTYGEQREVPYDKLYEPISLTFLVDRRMEVKKFFDLWANGVINPITRNINYYDDYTSTINIIIHDIQDNTIYSIELKEVYPKSIGQITLDNNAKEVMKLTVQFVYKYYTTREFYVTGGDAELSPNQVSENPNGLTPDGYYRGSSNSRLSPLTDKPLTNELTQEELEQSYAAALALQRAEIEALGMESGGGSAYYSEF